MLKIPPRLVIISKIHTASHLQVGGGVRFGIRFSLPPSVPQPRETIFRPHVRVVEIFPSRLSSHPCDMSGTPRPHSVDPATWSPAVRPRAAVFAEHCPREERVAIFEEIVRCLLLRCYCRNILVGDFAEYFGYVCYLGLSCTEMVSTQDLSGDYAFKLTSMCERA